jgi:diguanylate cyclase (GGDEF)-like protein/putative nucleotidyltransferase with HDIG domain
MRSLMSSTDTSSLANIRVLVLDDEEPIRNLIQTLLTRHGCIVETADDGRAGLRILLQRDFDVAVIDLRMRDMGGSAFLQEARSVWPWLGIVVISGHADDESRAHAHRYGVTRIMDKPMRMQELLDNVLAEAQEKKKRVERSSSQGLDHIQDQLALLRRFSEQAIAAESLEQAMRSLSLGLAKLLPGDAVAVLNLQADEHALYLNTLKPVTHEFVLALEHEVLQRYESLSGHKRPGDSLRVIFDPASSDAKGASTVGSSFSVPIVSGNEICGLLALAAADPKAFDASHTAFLYHAANQLATVLSALARMRQLAVRDALTGLYNRKGLEEEYQRIWMMGRRYRWAVGVAVIDIDHFKALNDTYGHLRGDEILREFSSVVGKVARETDVIGRYGGDELVVVLPQSGAAECMAFGERLLHALHQHVFCEKSLGGLQLCASIGVATSRGAPNETSEQLLAHADLALYEAKKQGRNRTCIHQADAPVVATISDTTPTITAPPTARAADTRTRGLVLVVDDDPSVGPMLARILRKNGYEVRVVLTAALALEAIRAAPGTFDVLLTDLNLPGPSGLELLDELRPLDDSMIKIVITGQATLDNAITSLRRGAYDFIEKPISTEQLTLTMDRALEYRRLKMENIRYQSQLEVMVREKSAALRTALDQVRTSYDFTLEAMAGLLDAREKSTAHHCTRVRTLSVILAREMGLSQTEIEDLSRGALLHDIGKISIPDAIMFKPGPLTEAERTIMRTHPEVGYRLLKSSAYLDNVAELVYSHHENFDGSGYPRGQKGEDIMLGARIFSVIDAYDAMRSDRVYHKAMSVDAALDELKRHSGTQFDPQVVRAFLKCHLAIEAAGHWPNSLK